jgi:elongator complex protein 3
LRSECGKSGELDIERIISRHNKGNRSSKGRFAKRKLLPYYLNLKRSDPARWAALGIDGDLEQRLLALLRVKPRRTASGVATITVITKPWPCAGNCLYCPNDLRMPKSYLSDEPACQRAERCCFDPYLQVASRLRTLTDMGHITDKVELIVLGGSFSDYPREYQLWFMTELFRSLNDAEDSEQHCTDLRAWYSEQGLCGDAAQAVAYVRRKQEAVNAGTLEYNQAVAQLYGQDTAWKNIAQEQVADFGELTRQQQLNEDARHRMVGLCVETRPEAVKPAALKLLRRLGCTKLQIGVQSLDPQVLARNKRSVSVHDIQEAFALLRLYGFKIHAHVMVNLLGSTPQADKADYRCLISDRHYLPDEVKLYPCVLVEGTGLCQQFANGSWRPYSGQELLDVLTEDVRVTPAFVRLSRIVRDISARDIIAGNKKCNLRQIVERTLEEAGETIHEMRYREIAAKDKDACDLSLEILSYQTTVSQEHFLQWLAPGGKLVGFLRLSLPEPAALAAYGTDLPVLPGEAMIRELHIYGKVAGIARAGSETGAHFDEGLQHRGLGRELIETAATIARDAGYQRLNVISSVGTRHYYRHLGFVDGEWYQQRALKRDS